MNFLTFYQKAFSFSVGVIAIIVALANLDTYMDEQRCGGHPDNIIFFVIFGLIGVPCLMHGIKQVRELYKRD